MNLNNLISIFESDNFKYFQGNVSPDGTLNILFSTIHGGKGNSVDVEIFPDNTINCRFWIKKTIMNIYKESFNDLTEKEFLRILKEKIE